MPKQNEKQAYRITYDVSRVSPSNHTPLTPAESRDVITSFQPLFPSENVIKDYERSVSYLVWDVHELKKVTPSQLSIRIKDGIHKNLLQLLNNLQSLEITDQILLDLQFTTQFLQNRESVTLNQTVNHLTLFKENVEAAMHVLQDVPRSGRMPAFAEQCLAIKIACAIQDDIGKPPPLTRTGIISRVLKCALSLGDRRMNRSIGKTRKDVMSLMKHARNEISTV